MQQTSESRVARSRWRLLAQICVTALALCSIAYLTPWRDRVELLDGRSYAILDRGSETFVVAEETDDVGPELRTVAMVDIRGVQPGVPTLLGSMHAGWLAAHLACLFGCASAIVLRWHYLLRHECSSSSVRNCAVGWARSQVLNLLPGGQLGGDIYRTAWSRGITRSLPMAAGIVAAERCAGLFALCVLAVIGFAMSDLAALQVRIGCAGAAVVGTVLLAPLVQWIARRLARPQARSGLQWKISTLFDALLHLLSCPRRLLVVLAHSFIAQLMVCLTFVCTDRALGFHTPTWCYLLAVPAVVLACLAPLHIAGIGIIEGGLWLILTHWNTGGAADVIALAAACRILNLAWLSLLSGAFLLKAPSPPRSNPHAINHRESSPHNQQSHHHEDLFENCDVHPVQI